MVAMIEEYREDCKKDPDLQSYDDKCRTGFDAFMKTLGDGHGGIPVDSLKGVVAYVCDMSKDISKEIIHAKGEMVNLMAGEEECLKIVEQYFSTTSEMLGFCCALDGFVVSARKSHSYITHVIEKLQTDYGKETTDDDGSTTHESADQDMKSRNRYKRIVEVLENLKSSRMVDASKSCVESLLQSIKCLYKKFDDMFEAMERYDAKLQKKLESVRTWKRITNMIFVSSMVCIGVLSVLAVGAVIVSPHLAVWAGTTVIGPAVRMIVANPNFITGVAKVGAYVMLPALAFGRDLTNHVLEQDEYKIMNQQEVVELMKDGATVAVKELGDIKYLIDSLVVHIDSMVETGKFGMDENEEFSVSFALKGIKDELGIFLEKIEELEKESKRCTSEIRNARDDVLTMVTGKVKVSKKGN